MCSSFYTIRTVLFCYFLIKYFELTNDVDFWNSSYTAQCHNLSVPFKVSLSGSGRVLQIQFADLICIFGLRNLKPKNACRNQFVLPACKNSAAWVIFWPFFTFCMLSSYGQIWHFLDWRYKDFFHCGNKVCGKNGSLNFCFHV